MIEAIELVKKYGDHVAVDHLSFRVEKGQILGFLGPNGAGKSTTMNMLTGYISMTEGQILVNGYDMLEEPEEAKRCIGYLPELPPLYMDMTVTEYLCFVTEIKKIPRNRRKSEIQRVIELTGLTEMRNRLIKNLSKGYKQRVGIAQALVGDPDVIILDEPTVGLDPLQIIEIRELMRKLAENHAVLLSSHIMQEISAVCDRVMIINRGTLIYHGSLEELREQAVERANIEVSAFTTKEKLYDILCQFVSGDKITEAPAEDERCAVFFAETSEDIRGEISQALLKNNICVEKLTRNIESLEEFFISSIEKAEMEYYRNLETEEDEDDEDDGDDEEGTNDNREQEETKQ